MCGGVVFNSGCDCRDWGMLCWMLNIGGGCRNWRGTEGDRVRFDICMVFVLSFGVVRSGFSSLLKQI